MEADAQSRHCGKGKVVGENAKVRRQKACRAARYRIPGALHLTEGGWFANDVTCPIGPMIGGFSNKRTSHQ